MHAEPMGKSRRQCRTVAETMYANDASQVICVVTPEQAGEAVRGEAVCALQSELRRMSAQLLTIQENERRRIATDLHDGLGQSLTLIRLALENLTELLAENSFREADESMQHLKTKVQEAFGELRRVAMDLRPSTLDDLGILATLSWFFREFESACRGIKIEKHLLVQENHIPVPLKITIFRILQEAVSNIVKHAHADHIRVSLIEADGALHLTIEDNGHGFDQVGRSRFQSIEKGLGLMSMKERANHSGGTYRIESAVGQGTRIYVSWSCS
ncbi:hypothetical protein SKTS_25040 [Sulfurimicrobium lacus]|uniref:histidine kinase n=2 Tax=Sulfurimicrobium lacus TaxID=2715678 RepID=A0A6F8VD20_9PROT|nr:hypothetical protein SKTS_25040 [Sulfurimicrobium lacus]